MIIVPKEVEIEQLREWEGEGERSDAVTPRRGDEVTSRCGDAEKG
jgi:hypothetical protein